MNYLTKNNFFFIIIIICGLFFRFYNINFDDLWIDEISTFWISNPDIPFIDSYNNHKKIEQTPYFFNFLIKIYFNLIGYQEEYSRMIPAVCSSLTMFTLCFLSKHLGNGKSYLLTLFLISFNIFLISYSQELRVYSSLLFFISLSMLFFFYQLEKDSNLFITCFIIFTVISILLHPFSFILISSYVIYSLYLVINREIHKKLYISLIILTIFFTTFYYIFLQNALDVPTWIIQPSAKFFTNFYFSKFFGSRLLGLIHLFILIIFLMQIFFKKIRFKHSIFFISFLFLSYFIPLIYGYIFDPIIMPRYIMFVIIPIVLIISHSIFEQKKIIKNIMIVLFSIITIGNLLTEQTFKQIYQERKVYKPEFKKALKIINNSSSKYYDIKLDPAQKILTDPWERSVNHYLNYLVLNKEFKQKKINKFEFKDYFWEICIYDINQDNCSVDDDFEIIENIKLNRLEITLLKKIW